MGKLCAAYLTGYTLSIRGMLPVTLRRPEDEIVFGDMNTASLLNSELGMGKFSYCNL